MIAYNHYIKFIPELECDKKNEGTFSNIINIRKSPRPELDKKFLYQLTFFNNQGRDLWLHSDREMARTQKGQSWAFEVKDVVSFFWGSGSLTLEYIPHVNFTPELLKYWCLHIVLPIFFTAEETYDFLHAGAVEIDNKPILFIAESFGGKSTLTDFFLQLGHTIISDDKVATYQDKGLFYSVPSHPHHRPYRKMEDLGFFIKNFATISKPMHAAYSLKKAEADAKITITKLTGTEKFISLRYASDINLYFLKPKRFNFLMQMANKLPVYQVTVPWDMDRLNEVHDHIVKHSNNIQRNLI